MTAATQAVRDAIADGYPYRYRDEVTLHFGLEAAMRKAGLDPQPEVRLTRGRIDFLVGTIGIEVKVSGSAATLRRQLARYAEDDRVTHLLVVTTLYRHLPLRGYVGGKPVDVLTIGGP